MDKNRRVRSDEYISLTAGGTTSWLPKLGNGNPQDLLRDAESRATVGPR